MNLVLMGFFSCCRIEPDQQNMITTQNAGFLHLLFYELDKTLANLVLSRKSKIKILKQVFK